MQRVEQIMPMAFAPAAGGGSSTSAVDPPVIAVPPSAAPRVAPESAAPPLIPQFTPAFALIDDVAEGGPASSAGLAVGDQLVSMGDLTATELRGPGGRLNLAPLGQLVGGSEGQALAVVRACKHAHTSAACPPLPQFGSHARLNARCNVPFLTLRARANDAAISLVGGLEQVVLRDSAYQQLQLTPRRWSGNGLLGCHLNPL